MMTTQPCSVSHRFGMRLYVVPGSDGKYDPEDFRVAREGSLEEIIARSIHPIA